MITTPAKPWTDPTEWRDELDDIATMLREAGRSGPLRDEIATLLAQVGDDDTDDAERLERFYRIGAKTEGARVAKVLRHVADAVEGSGSAGIVLTDSSDIGAES